MDIFERTELKYVISLSQQKRLLEEIAAYIEPDVHGESTVCSLYFDTPSFLLIRNSLEKPLYKEKLRLRSYGVPRDTSKVFLELKKKYKGVVYKRREEMTEFQAERWIATGIPPQESQIMQEICYASDFYGGLKPKMLISCRRKAYYCKQDAGLRFTFDTHLLSRTTDLCLKSGSYGEPIVPEDTCILEIKALHSMPLWLTHALNELQIVPHGFSKYGTGYMNWLKHQTFSCQRPA